MDVYLYSVNFVDKRSGLAVASSPIRPRETAGSPGRGDLFPPVWAIACFLMLPTRTSPL